MKDSLLIATYPLTATSRPELSDHRALPLRRSNIGLGIVHASQTVAILALASAFALPVTATNAIFVSLFVFFSIFALSMWLHCRRVGRWKSDVFAARAYFMLSLVAKSALAWPVFAGTLAG